MKKKKITANQIKFIINMISLTIFAVAYLYIFDNYTGKTDDIYQEVELIKAQMKEREQRLSEEDEVLSEIPEVKEEGQKVIDSFPVYIAKEDNFMFIEKMEEALDVQISSVNVTDNVIFYETSVPARSEVLISENLLPTLEESDVGSTDDNKEENEQVMTGIQNTISMSFVTTYQGFKELVEYIREYPERTIIENASVSYDSTTGNLTGSLMLKRFALAGSGKEYKAPVIDGINIGTDNIFGTDD
ncbi:hypothetical protein I5677_02615 [Mobilitalea sibirica]|uniref:Pilus assembly protein PilO n=1 Tax=Mobilitalea sibirica TaxID=1462919 RepID=A0A8J7H7W6_9FIRM|nr:hypothetical protein [Mobilitalea sibirica]MBH1939785.1 hypothetical protein [Mobilitalea sibirica]